LYETPRENADDRGLVNTRQAGEGKEAGEARVASTAIPLRGGAYDICSGPMSGRERERKGRHWNRNEWKRQEEEEEEEPGKKRGRPVINWLRISFAPFFLSVLSRATSRSCCRRNFDGRRGIGESSDDKEESSAEIRGGAAQWGCNLNENLHATLFTGRDVPSVTRDDAFGNKGASPPPGLQRHTYLKPKF